MIGIPPFPAHEKTALCLDRAVNSVGWQSIFSCFYMYPFVNRRNLSTMEKLYRKGEIRMSLIMVAVVIVVAAAVIKQKVSIRLASMV